MEDELKRCEICIVDEGEANRIMEEASAACPDCNGEPCFRSAFRALQKAGYIRQPEPVSIRQCVKPAYKAWLRDSGDFVAIAKAVLDAVGVKYAT